LCCWGKLNNGPFLGQSLSSVTRSCVGRKNNPNAMDEWARARCSIDQQLRQRTMALRCDLGAVWVRFGTTFASRGPLQTELSTLSQLETRNLVQPICPIPAWESNDLFCVRPWALHQRPRKNEVVPLSVQKLQEKLTAIEYKTRPQLALGNSAKHHGVDSWSPMGCRGFIFRFLLRPRMNLFGRETDVRRALK